MKAVLRNDPNPGWAVVVLEQLWRKLFQSLPFPQPDFQGADACGGLGGDSGSSPVRITSF